jgi:hypothetical protein
MSMRIRLVPSFFIKLFIIATTCFASGCEASTIKYYSYTETTKEFDWGKIEVRLDGEYKRINDQEEVYSAPYSLKVFFMGENLKGCSVSINEIILKNSEGKFALSKKDVSKNITWSDIHKSTRASFVFEKMHIAYEDYSLDIKGVISGCLNQSFNETFVFEKNYHEEKVTFWDKLMGI